MADSLLPAGATPLEHAVAEATARLSDVPVPVGDLWNPDTCPAAVLPYLAWALSVDGWDADWTEAQRREAIRRSVYVHRHKGTIGAVQAALGAVDYSVALVEWFGEDPPAPPYTFRAEVAVTDRGMDDATQAQIERLIMGAKNVRSHLTSLRMVGVLRAPVYFGAWAAAGETVEVLPHQTAEIISSGTSHIGAGCAAYDTVSVYPEGP